MDQFHFWAHHKKFIFANLLSNVYAVSTSKLQLGQNAHNTKLQWH